MLRRFHHPLVRRGLAGSLAVLMLLWAYPAPVQAGTPAVDEALVAEALAVSDGDASVFVATYVALAQKADPAADTATLRALAESLIHRAGGQMSTPPLPRPQLVAPPGAPTASTGTASAATLQRSAAVASVSAVAFTGPNLPLLAATPASRPEQPRGP